MHFHTATNLPRASVSPAECNLSRRDSRIAPGHTLGSWRLTRMNRTQTQTNLLYSGLKKVHLQRPCKIRKSFVTYFCNFSSLLPTQPRNGAEAGRECGERAGQDGQCVHVRGGEEGDPAEECPVPAGRQEGDVYQEMEM